ncbi:FAD-dependent oxidoreductase [Bradyrhizobium sp.]|uniref:FAD-dependent oxidoreductase n=1 Tax=Bradyrhizobium sp. TaxID=376 RepID=UPI0039E549CB
MPAAEIVGGGIAGLVASIQLARHGWSVRLHERSDELRAGGNGLPIFENGLRILSALGLDEAIRTRGHQLNKWIIRLSSGQTTKEYEPFAATGGRIVMFQRQALVDPLAEAAVKAGVRIELGAKVVRAEREGVLHLEGGRRIDADLVVGADGINSIVRRSVAGTLPLGKHRKGAIRLLIPIHDGDFPDGNDRVAAEYNDEGGRRIGLLPCSSRTMYMILVALLSDSEALKMPIDPDVWKATFPTLGRFIDRVGTAGHYDEYHSIFPPTWHFGKCALIGDAAHGMTPALGQGANSAMMTAYSLGASDLTTGSLSDALTAWEDKIRPLVHFTQKFAEGITEGRLDPKNDIFFSDPALRPLLSADIPNMRFDMPDFAALNPSFSNAV